MADIDRDPRAALDQALDRIAEATWGAGENIEDVAHDISSYARNRLLSSHDKSVASFRRLVENNRRLAQQDDPR